jgi:hypothetical protein
MKRNIKIALISLILIGLITSNLLMIFIGKDWLGGIGLILGGLIAYSGKKIINKRLDN